jgi:hypothetical protein
MFTACSSPCSRSYICASRSIRRERNICERLRLDGVARLSNGAGKIVEESELLIIRLYHLLDLVDRPIGDLSGLVDARVAHSRAGGDRRTGIAPRRFEQNVGFDPDRRQLLGDQEPVLTIGHHDRPSKQSRSATLRTVS